VSVPHMHELDASRHVQVPGERVNVSVSLDVDIDPDRDQQRLACGELRASAMGK